MKSHNIFCKDISITKGLSREDMFRFSGVNVEIQAKNERATREITFHKKEMMENIKVTESETEYASS